MVKITSDQSILNNKDLNFVDMHHHSTASDGDFTPKTLAKVFIKKKIGLCIADHNQIKGSVYLSKQKELFTIPAVEITSKEAKDVLCYFYNINDLISFWENEIKAKIKNNALFNLNRTTISTFELIDKMKNYNGIPILAHPFAIKPKTSFHFLKKQDFLKKIDGIELLTLGHAKPQEMKFIKQFKKPLIAGTDSHVISSLNALTASYSRDIGSFLDSVLKRKIIIYYKKDSRIKRIMHRWVVFKNNMHLSAPKN